MRHRCWRNTIRGPSRSTGSWPSSSSDCGAWGQTIDWFPKGFARTFARSAHIVTGILVAGLLVNRVVWRLTRGARLPAAEPAPLGQIAKLVQYALYLLIATTVVLGIANAWIRGDNVFNLFTIPSLAPGDKALREQVETWHGWSANALVIVAALHAAAGLFHHFVLKDAVLARVWPALARRRSAP